MSVSTITVGGSNVTLVAMPSSPGARSVEFTVKDSVAIVDSPFTGQAQVQQWPGADMLMGTFTLPALTRYEASAWIAFLMQLRGMSFAFQLGDPLNTASLGTPSGTPVVNNTLAANGNAAMSQTLTTSGWTVSTSGLLLPGDYIQIGYRAYRVLDNVTSDSSGNSTFNIWPSLREIPSNGTAVLTENTQGLFRLSSNNRKFSFDVTKLTHLSFQFQEYR